MVKKKSEGFTLIELLIVLAIIATLLSLVTPQYFKSLERAKETALKHDLNIVRESIDRFYNDQDRYPNNLQELLAQGYLKQIPVDPITNRNDSWVLISPPKTFEQDGIYDILSGATGNSSDGSEYSSY